MKSTGSLVTSVKHVLVEVLSLDTVIRPCDAELATILLFDNAAVLTEPSRIESGDGEPGFEPDDFPLAQDAVVRCLRHWLIELLVPQLEELTAVLHDVLLRLDLSVGEPGR